MAGVTRMYKRILVPLENSAYDEAILVHVTALAQESRAAVLLVLSQVILSLQLSFAVFPLVMFTSEKAKMGEFVNAAWLKVMAYAVAVLIASLNVWLLFQTVRGWLA